LRRSEPRGDSGESGWRKEAVKTGCRILTSDVKSRVGSADVSPKTMNSQKEKTTTGPTKGANLVVLNAALSLAEGRGCPTGVKRYGAVLLLPGWYELVRSDTALYACILK